MKKYFKRLTAIMMVLIISSITSVAGFVPKRANAATEDEKSGKYLSQIMIGMGDTEKEASKELEENGYIILKDESGKKADLNEGAGDDNILKRGASKKIVYLGYKTTANIDDAITDMAVMNMNGGYSIEDYNALMDQQMESQIKPFVDRFQDTLEEYRKNYKKPKSTKNYIRANYMRKLLNKMTDDDTGGQPMGDLLLNKTKYEMGDEEYNKLSDTEKAKHADILTILMQANGKATLTMETLLTKASDTSTKDNWIDRFREITLSDLKDQVKSEDKSATTQTDINSALDRKYHDTATAILKKWEVFQSEIKNYEEIAEDINDTTEDITERTEEVEDMDITKATESEVDELLDVHEETTDGLRDLGTVAVGVYLNSVKYEDESLLDFFMQDKSNFSGKSNIRKLYPMVEALSPGQIAGLDFVSIMDLVQLAISDENSYKDVQEMSSDVKSTSIYESVDRAIYEKGGVALTSDALRERARERETDPKSFKLSTLTTVLWISSACFAGASIASKIVSKAMTKAFNIPTAVKNIPKAYICYWDNAAMLKDTLKNLNKQIDFFKGHWGGLNTEGYIETATKIQQRLDELEAAGTNPKPTNVSGSMANKLAIGLAVIAVIMTVVSTVMTITEAMTYYDTEYISIPNYIVDESDIKTQNDKGEDVMIKNPTAYYKVVKCNRTAGDSDITKKNFEIMGDHNDLKGDIGKEWLSLYTVKNVKGDPILADSLLYKKGDSKLPSGYKTGIHEFGNDAACDFNKKGYLFVDNPPVIKVYFKQEERKDSQKAAETGSVFSGGMFGMGIGFGVILGGLFAGLALKRKKIVKSE